MGIHPLPTSGRLGWNESENLLGGTGVTWWREPEEGWFCGFELFSKLKAAFCEYWTSTKIKIKMACVSRESEIKTTLEQKQWLKLKMLFLLDTLIQLIVRSSIPLNITEDIFASLACFLHYALFHFLPVFMKNQTHVLSFWDTLCQYLVNCRFESNKPYYFPKVHLLDVFKCNYFDYLTRCIFFNKFIKKWPCSTFWRLKIKN